MLPNANTANAPPLSHSKIERVSGVGTRQELCDVAAVLLQEKKVQRLLQLLSFHNSSFGLLMQQPDIPVEAE